ncbi:MAG: ABC transporter substrate-binding protein [Ignavibacteria bacterium]
MAKLITFFLFLLITQIYPQDSASAKNESEFRHAVDLYQSHQYEQAFKIFEKISEKKNKDGNISASFLFKGKILAETKRYSEAENVLYEFLQQYPSSKYDNEAHLTLAKIYLELEEYKEAFLEVCSILVKNDSGYYYDYSKTAAEKIAMNYIEPDYLKQFNDSISTFTDSEKIKPFILLVLGKLLYQINNYSSAEKYISELITNFPNSPERQEAGDIFQKISESKKQSGSKIYIGVLLPLSGNLSGESSTAAKEILEGIKYALSEYNSMHEEKIGLLIRDTELKQERLKIIKDEFESISGLKSIIGPVFSNEVRNALQVFNGTEIPIISPTATDSDLTSINDFFFQANPPFGIRGKIIAQYIYYVENKRKIAVLTSNDGYSIPLSSNFMEEFSRMGGEITSIETYKSNSYDFSKQISNIAKDSLILEGIYIPLTNKLDAAPIITEIVKNKLNVSIYGDQDWFLAKGYKASSGFMNQLIFSSDYFIDYNSQEYQELNRGFYKLSNTDANRNVLYGYDTARYLLTVLRNSTGDGSSIKNKMESGITANGFHNNISFNENRINRFLNIIRFKDDKFELIDKFQAGI